jgi:hypothetical protein
MENKHTPGPWEVGRSGSLQPDSVKKHPVTGEPYQELSAVVGTTKRVAHIYLGNRMNEDFDAALAEQHTNAHLIAAAPELLEACAGLLQIVQEIMPSSRYADHGCHKLVKLASEAIAKAKGGK